MLRYMAGLLYEGDCDLNLAEMYYCVKGWPEKSWVDIFMANGNVEYVQGRMRTKGRSEQLTDRRNQDKRSSLDWERDVMYLGKDTKQKRQIQLRTYMGHGVCSCIQLVTKDQEQAKSGSNEASRRPDAELKSAGRLAVGTKCSQPPPSLLFSKTWPWNSFQTHLLSAQS